MSRGKSTDTIFSNVMGKGSKGEESINKPVTFLQREPGWFVLVQVTMRLGYRTLSVVTVCLLLIRFRDRLWRTRATLYPIPWLRGYYIMHIEAANKPLQLLYSISIVNSNPLIIVKFIVNIPVQLQSIPPYSNRSQILSILLYFLSYFSDKVWFKIIS